MTFEIWSQIITWGDRLLSNARCNAAHSILIVAQNAENFPKMVRGNQSPTVVTLSRAGSLFSGLVSVKQCLTSWCVVSMCTSCCFFWRANAASTINLSAPPIPKSGWRKTIWTLVLEYVFCSLYLNIIVMTDDVTFAELCLHLIGLSSDCSLDWIQNGLKCDVM